LPRKRKPAAAPAVRFDYFERVRFSLTPEQVLDLDEKARQRWEVNDVYRLFCGDLLEQAAIQGLLMLPDFNDYHLDGTVFDGLGNDSGHTRAELIDWLKERGYEPR